MARVADFYVTLRSDSCTDIYPSNTTSNFITRFPHPIELKGEWQVGMVEFHSPNTFEVINSNNNSLYYYPGDDTGRRVDLPVGNYSDIEQIISTLESRIHEQHRDMMQMKYINRTNQVHIRVTDGCKLFIPKGLSRVFGSEEPLEIDDTKKCVMDVKYRSAPLYLNVLTDIVYPELVGATHQHLLRSVTVPDHKTRSIEKSFSYPHYITVNKNHIDTISIDIRDDADKPVSFIGGPSTVKVHFRLRKSPYLL